MKRYKIKLMIILFCFSIIGLNCSTYKETHNSNSKQAILATMRKANKYFMNKWPNTGKPIYTNKMRPSNIWTRGVYYEGLMALYKIDNDREYYNYAVDWGDKHHWGMRNGIETRNADDHTCGQTYIDLYQIDSKPERIRSIQASLDLMIASGKYDDWTWIDAIQMAMPVFAKFGVLLKDEKYFDYMYQMYGYSKRLEGGGYTMQPKNCGGEIKILSRLIKSQMVSIVTGPEEMDGWLPLW